MIIKLDETERVRSGSFRFWKYLLEPSFRYRLALRVGGGALPGFLFARVNAHVDQHAQVGGMLAGVLPFPVAGSPMVQRIVRPCRRPSTMQARAPGDVTRRPKQRVLVSFRSDHEKQVETRETSGFAGFCFFGPRSR
ncbi:hypothetical protein AB3X96_17070 [Paraburkholderia sp. BR13439]|uniref:hypothetical protein n=1 Tax=Paraburkholderia sp. BR13439 TaxID=3236996 RepID=UPI0034CE9757